MSSTQTPTVLTSRPLHEIAKEITADWRPMNYAAVPYVSAMGQLTNITDKFGADDGETIVSYFLVNCQAWRGPKAREIKAELKLMLKHAQQPRSYKTGARN